MDSLDATQKVLEDSAEPLHYQEITKRILAQGIWHTEGKTPDQTINARIAVDIKKFGDRSRFVRTEPGVFALREWGHEEYIPELKTTQPASPKDEAKYSFTDAAELVLENYSEKRPIHYREIANRILELDLVNTQGLTPEATLYSMIVTEINRQSKRGNTPRFIKYGQGVVGLRKWMGEGLAYQIDQHNQGTQKKLLAFLRKMDPGDFEHLIGRLLGKMGFEEITVTKRSGDGGVDVRGALVVGNIIRTQMAVQVKRNKEKNNVQSEIVQKLRGSLGAHDQGMIITTSGFSSGAIKEAARSDAIPVALVNGGQLVDLLIEHQVLVKRVPYELINLDVDDESE